MSAKTKNAPTRRVAKKASPRAPKQRRMHERLLENDATYFLKLVVVLLLATVWLRLSQPIQIGVFVINALPLGIAACAIGVRLLEKIQADRKIWYAILLITGVLGFFVPGVGIVI